MNVLLSAANFVVQRSLIKALVARGHTVGLLGQEAELTAAEWPAQVTPYPSVADVLPAARGFESAVVVDDAVAAPSETRTSGGGADLGPQLREIGHQVYVSPDAAAPAPGSEWVRIVPAPVYGVGNDPVTVFLLLMRALPAVPVVPGIELQLTWHEDLANAVAEALPLAAAGVNRTFRVASPQVVSHEVLYEEIALLIGRRPTIVRLPEFIGDYGKPLATALGIGDGRLRAVLEFVSARRSQVDPSDNALPRAFGVRGTSVRDGLTRMVQDLEELTPLTGVGTLDVKRFHADIVNSRYDAPSLMREFRVRFREAMPIEVGIEPSFPRTRLDEGAIITMHLPARGHVQVRVERADDREVVLATLRGHVLAGFVRFRSLARDGAVRFQVLTCDAAANPVDWVGLTLGGTRAQDAQWTTVVRNVIALSGGIADAVHVDAHTLSGRDARIAHDWIDRIVRTRRLHENTAAGDLR